MKRNIVIGCDYDGTLNDLFLFYKNYGEKLYKKDIVDPSKYGLRGMFDISKKEENKFGVLYFLKYCKSLEIRPGAREVLERQRNGGAKIHAITARKFATNKGFLGNYMRKLVIRYASANSLIFDSFEFSSEKFAKRDKYAACKKLNVDIMIDDLPEVAYFLADKGIQVALIDTPYNQTVKHKNITRCFNFEDVNKIIDKVKENLRPENENFEVIDSESLNRFKKSELKEYYEDYKDNLKLEVVNKKKLELGKKRYNILFPLISIFTLRFLLVKVKNKENIPFQDGLIIISNHLDSFDQFSIAYALEKKYITGYAASTIKNTIRGRLANYSNSAIFVDRKNSTSRKIAKKEFDKRVISGYNALVFPEGTRKNKYKKYEGKELLEFKLGAFSSAKITGAPILPIVIYKKSKKSLKSTLIIGEIFYVEKEDDLKTTAKTCEKFIKKTLKEERKNHETINKK